MSSVRVDVPTAKVWPRPVLPSPQRNGASDLADQPLEIGPRFSKVTRPAEATVVRAPIVSNEQASSALSLFATAFIIAAISAFAGTAYEFIADQDYHDLWDFLASGALMAIIFCGALRLLEERQPMKLSHFYGRARDASVAWITTLAIFLAVAFTVKLGDALSRGAIISTFLLGSIAVPLSHMHAPLLLARIRKSSTFMQRDVIVIGARGDASLTKLLQELVRGGYAPHLVEFDAVCNGVEWPSERKALVNQVLGMAHRLGPGEICFALSQVPHSRAESIMRSLALVPRAILAVPDEMTSEFLRHGLSEIGDRIAVDVQKAPMTVVGRTTKRAMDIVLSSALIVFFAPLLIGVAVAVKLDSPGPVFFCQRRNGYQGRLFRIIKYRTMTVMVDGDVPNQVCKDDDRVTRVGRILRKYSLDELPQLINVLTGEMSLIGPRPHPLALDTFYSKLIENYEIRQHVKPGITGWAQVNGLRGETQTLDLMYRRIEFDCWYAKNCNVILDFRILARTVLEVLRPRNAY